MKIVNGKVLIGQRFVSGGVEFDHIIRRAGREVIGEKTTIGDPAVAGTARKNGTREGMNGEVCLDAENAYIIPGLVDIHTHGAVGADASDGSPEGLLKMSAYYAANGITSWVPATMTLPEPELAKTLRSMRDFTCPGNGAKLAGVNLEGPFISCEKRGAQNSANIQSPDAALFYRLQETSGDRIRLITVAPEMPGAEEFIREVSKCCTVSIGHTAADYSKAKEAYESGATHTTHLYNGMSPFGHREPGIVGAAFDSGATVELICDGYHVAPPVIRMTWQLFGDRVVLISDSGRCAGMPDGVYDLGGQSITLTEGKACLTGTNTLACSSINLLECVRRAVSFGIPLEAAVYGASTAPAKVIGADTIGSIAPGKCADLVVLGEDLQIRAVYIDGRRVR